MQDGIESSGGPTPEAGQAASAPAVDRLGAVASTLCAVHCAVCALLPALFGALGVGFLLSHTVEWGLSAVAIAFGAGALMLGWRRHRSRMVAALLLGGIVGLLLSRGLEAGSGHDHGEGHHTEAVADAHGHGDHGHDDHGHMHAGFAHLLGAGVGVLAGLLLVAGHLLNLRETRRCNADNCAPGATS